MNFNFLGVGIFRISNVLHFVLFAFYPSIAHRRNRQATRTPVCKTLFMLEPN